MACPLVRLSIQYTFWHMGNSGTSDARILKSDMNMKKADWYFFPQLALLFRSYAPILTLSCYVGTAL